MNGLVPNLHAAAEIQEGYLHCGGFPQRNKASQLHTRLPNQKYWCQEELPPQPLGMKNSGDSEHLNPEMKGCGKSRCTLNGPVHRLCPPGTQPGLQWRDCDSGGIKGIQGADWGLCFRARVRGQSPFSLDRIFFLSRAISPFFSTPPTQWNLNLN